jgi:hypothetical protein
VLCEGHPKKAINDGSYFGLPVTRLFYQRLGRRSFVLLDTLILMVRVDTFMTFDNFVTPRGEIHAESSMTGITNRK